MQGTTTGEAPTQRLRQNAHADVSAFLASESDKGVLAEPGGRRLLAGSSVDLASWRPK
jgi:hypothetical protein